ncbi:hypothetical protein ACS0TY_026073 [Phlomoides rotata]
MSRCFLSVLNIADVTNFVHHGTPLDDEAAQRGTSVYLVERRIDMVPKPLTEGVLANIMEMTPKAEIISTRYTKAIVKSCAALSYVEAQARMDDSSVQLVFSGFMIIMSWLNRCARGVVVASNSWGPCLADIASKCWSIWREKCSLFHSPGAMADKVAKVWRFSSEGAKLFRGNFLKASEVTKAATSSSRWLTPRVETMDLGNKTSIWTDARYEEPGVFAVGVVIKKGTGVVVAAECRRINPPGSILAAELQGILEGIRFFKSMGVTEAFSFDAVDSVIKGDKIWNAAGA